MKHVAAYLLAQLGGNASPTADDITTILAAAARASPAAASTARVAPSPALEAVRLVVRARFE